MLHPRPEGLRRCYPRGQTYYPKDSQWTACIETAIINPKYVLIALVKWEVSLYSATVLKHRV